jgi:hypothetical protein
MQHTKRVCNICLFHFQHKFYSEPCRKKIFHWISNFVQEESPRWLYNWITQMKVSDNRTGELCWLLQTYMQMKRSQPSHKREHWSVHLYDWWQSWVKHNSTVVWLLTLQITKYLLQNQFRLPKVCQLYNLFQFHLLVQWHKFFPQGNSTLVNYIIYFQFHIRIDLGEIGWGSVDWIQFSQDRDRWRALVNMVMNLQVLAPQS